MSQVPGKQGPPARTFRQLEAEQTIKGTDDD